MPLEHVLDKRLGMYMYRLRGRVVNRLDPRSAGVGRKKQRAPTPGRPESASRRHRLADAFHRWRHPTIKINFSPADSIDITQRISGQKHVCLY